jgi:hypothetical protein
MGCSICGKARIAGRGLCNACYVREHKRGTLWARPKKHVPLADRILAKIAKDEKTGCWNWTAHGRQDGYGLVWSEGRAERAHRAAYRAFTGNLAADDVVCHTCDNRRCVNPDHLFIGTRGDNNRDAAKKGRNAFGPRNGHAKLTPAQVVFIRGSAGVSQTEVARQFGVSQSTISRIISGERQSKVTFEVGPAPTATASKAG